MQFLGFLAVIFGPIMEWIYRFIPNYGWALIVFTLLVNLVLLPLRIKQQKSTARMSAFQPKMQEIQKKYAKDKARQQEELMKFHDVDIQWGNHDIPAGIRLFHDGRLYAHDTELSVHLRYH